ncbi:MAG TPA: hypothetical protein VHZ28_06550 [Terracidiphilus sp.]|jgi:hypothetical protein|nr:hypothetical protein [Terracidiphilus sp.]
MKVRHPLKRRSFSVSTAGWFTVLRPDKWSAASRTPGGFYPSSVRTALDGRNMREAIMPPSIVSLDPQDRRMMRTGWIVLAAMAITSALLWWIMHP